MLLAFTRPPSISQAKKKEKVHQDKPFFIVSTEANHDIKNISSP